MALGAGRDPAVIAAGVARWVESQEPGAPCTVHSVERASAGWSNESFLLRLERGGEPRSLAVRLPGIGATFPDQDLGLEAAVQNFVGSAGVRTASPARFEPDAGVLGVPFLVMPLVEGHVPGEAAIADPWIMGGPAERQRALHETFLDTLARIHTIPWRGTLLAERLRGAPGGGDGSGGDAGSVGGGAGSVEALADEVRWWQRYVGWAAGDEAPVPALVSGLAWCLANLPDRVPEPALAWGDARLGNLVVDESAELVAVLDWDMAMIGPPELDLAWHLALEAFLEELVGTRVPGFLERDEAVARYESQLGRPVVDLGWFEIFALLRATSISIRQAKVAAELGQRYMAPADGSHPMLGAIATRIAAAG